MNAPRLGLLVSNHDAVRALLPLLRTSHFALTQHWLDAAQLIKSVSEGAVDVVLVSTGPRALDPSTILTVAGRVPLVAFDRDPESPQWAPLGGNVLPWDAEPNEVLDALDAAIRRQPRVRRRVQIETARQASDRPAEAESAHVITVMSGYGSPGRSTVALNLAATLGAVARTVLVDLDLGGALLAGLLELNTARNLGTLAKSSEPALPVSRDLQRLHTSCPNGWVLAGLPRPDARGLLDVSFVERLVGELRHRFRYVVCDTGTQWLDNDTLAAAPMTLADRLLLVAAPDDPGIWRARQALEQARSWWPDRDIAIVVNRHRGRQDASQQELQYALGETLAAVLPMDQGACSRAVLAHKPAVYGGRSRLARAMVDLGRRLHGGEIEMPTEPRAGGARGWLRRLTVGERT